MENIDFFNFENKDKDFPIYRNNPYISKAAWLVLFLVLIPGILLISDSSVLSSIMSCLVILVPLLYYLNWDYTLLFYKPKRKDILMAVALFIGYIAYSLLIMEVISPLNLSSAMVDTQTNLMVIPPMAISLMTEELIKFVPFMFFLKLFYKYSGNRKLSVVLSVLFVMVFFAFLHSFSLEFFLFALIVQGFGSIFEFYGYVKTKNLWIPYITHLCTDVFITLLMLLG